MFYFIKYRIIFVGEWSEKKSNMAIVSTILHFEIRMDSSPQCALNGFVHFIRKHRRFSSSESYHYQAHGVSKWKTKAFRFVGVKRKCHDLE